MELSLELFKDDHMIDFMSLQKIMQNHPYILAPQNFVIGI